MRTKILISVITINALAVGLLYGFQFNIFSIGFAAVSIMLLIMVLQDILQTQHSLKRNFPIIARLRWVFEAERDKIRQYFNESDIDGVPFNRVQRSIVYQRSKRAVETVPFGTQLNVYAQGYEFVEHSLFAKSHDQVSGTHFMVGSDRCSQPYRSSLINISAMSYGSLGKTAVRALNMGAKEGGFAHNTGEGGVSPYHREGGDLILQIGTGYFGAGRTDENGVRQFDPTVFKQTASLNSVKMIEIKLSQGAKPGHGGILPAKKNTPEIAAIRMVEPYTQIVSPPSHTAFYDYQSMVKFIQEVRELSDGKPVGIKLCVGKKSEVRSMIATFAMTNNYPDFITIDGSEGGTGSAPLEFTDFIGTPLVEGVVTVVKLLEEYELRDQIRVIASGKIIHGFDMIRLKALGVDGFNIARGFMLSLGCIQARECHKDTCPVGIATQRETLTKALVVEKKYIRVKNYHNITIQKFLDIVGAMGLSDTSEVTADKVFRRMKNGEILSFAEIYDLKTEDGDSHVSFAETA